jgi:transcriptional regulator with XRE-family HTH domain
MPSATVDLEAVAATVYRLRVEKGLRQQELATLADVSDRTIRIIELGERRAHDSTYGKLALALEVPVSELMGEAV